MTLRTTTSASRSEVKGDMDGAIAEYREALRLNPNNDMAHYNLGLALEHKGDWDGAMAESVRRCA